MQKLVSKTCPTLGLRPDWLFLSDLHLGDKTGSDDFSFSDYKRLRSAEEDMIKMILLINPHRLCINGDGLELWQHNEKAVRKIYKRLLHIINTVYNGVWCKGNHDEKIKNGVEHITLDLPNGKKVLVTHGHQNDSSMSSFWVKAGVYILGLVEKVFPSIDNDFLSWKKGDTTIYVRTNKYVNALLDCYDIVITGHTHKKGIRKVVDTGYTKYSINTGTCQGGRLEGAYIIGNDIVSFELKGGVWKYQSIS